MGGVLPVQPSAAASAADYMNISSMHPVALQPLPMPVPMYFGGGGGGGGGGSVHLSHQTVCPAHKTTSSSRERAWLGISPDNAGFTTTSSAQASSGQHRLTTPTCLLCLCVRVCV